MISALYLNKNILEKIKAEFEKSNILKLEAFFNQSFYEDLKAEIENLKFRHKKAADKYSFSESTEIEKIKPFLENPEMSFFLKNLTSKKISDIKVKKFSHKDYTLLHDSEISAEQTKALIFICEKWPPDLGGNFVFTKSDGKTFYITPMENTLSLVKKKKDWKEFVQYINHQSSQRQIFVIEINLK